MSKKKFTEKEINLLSKNQYVKNVSEKGITYTDEFKRIFIGEYEKGRPSRDIFNKYGLDVNILGIQRVISSGKRWRAAYKENGVLGLRDTRKDNSGRPSEKELSIEEKYARSQAQIKLLKAENELLKKLDMLERMARKKK